MEGLLEIALPLLVLVISFVAKSSKSKKAVIQHMEAAKVRTTESYLRREEMKQEQKLRPAAPAAVEKMPEKIPEKQPESKEQPLFAEGLAIEHRHEGRQDVPCPADEIRPSQRVAQKPKVPMVPGLKLSFDRNSVVQGFVMSEILNRPRPGMRR